MKLDGLGDSWHDPTFLSFSRSGAYPAKMRGQFFDGSDALTSSDFNLNHSFSFSMVIRPTFSDNSKIALFTKYDTSNDDVYIRFYMFNSGYLGLYVRAADGTSFEGQNGTTLVSGAWVSVGFSIDLIGTGNTTDLKIFNHTD
jgi:hypothetical protein